MSHKALVAGVGMIPFRKPGQSEAWDLMAAEAARRALADAGIGYTEVQQAYVGYVYGESTSGQSALYHVGLSGIPIVNVNNNCSTGSTALFLARQAVEAGIVDVALALGFEQMNPGALAAVYNDRKPAMEMFSDAMTRAQTLDPKAPGAAQFFGGAGAEHQRKYGTQTSTFAKISEKARRHAANNPFAVFRDPLSLHDILQSPHIYGPLTRYQCCPPTSGAAAAVIVSRDFARKKGLDGLVEIAAQSMTTDYASTFAEPTSMMRVVGYDMARQAAHQAYEAAGIGPEDIQVVEMHDCFTANELITYEALGLCREGEAERFILDGDNTYGGKYVTNPSGGLLSKGHPLGATGLAQCTELVWQLRNKAEARQVEGAKIALQHNLGLGGACVVTIYQPTTV